MPFTENIFNNVHMLSIRKQASNTLIFEGLYVCVQVSMNAMSDVSTFIQKAGYSLRETFITTSWYNEVLRV